ncbi:MAG TPA: Mu transposase C-terminal domain-containing protein [Ktedonobacteraceae bacterium]|jgi:putative transposase|nr:Mu transposase C-terminal domain-containing protein [Ktedonobacteraceae bacterium]
MTPQAAYLWGRKQGGEREHRRIPYDDRFLKATCPTTTKGTAIVQKGSGIKVNHFYYWNNVFRNPEVIKTAVPVRYDPFDLSTAFAFVQGQWVTCRAPYLGLEGHTEKELLIATTELRRQARRDGARADLSAERLATHMSKAASHEDLLRQRLRELDQKKVLSIIASQSGHVQPQGMVKSPPSIPPEAVRAEKRLAALSQPVDVSRLKRLGDYR